ncbi:UNVERIFIED_CONTAM: BTB/POZ domain-containing protein [Sesamum calycinum]|uniref:BTB/POZ domain-containing protein n=1 Tax=Sesamum calycinum TaxID=2727403 RepID=A0AAW2N3V7_9LAMI
MHLSNLSPQTYIQDIHQHNESSTLSRIGDRSSSDVVVRIRTQEGRDWIYCHSDILVKKSKYFADRLSDNWPTCQILDSRNCVEEWDHKQQTCSSQPVNALAVVRIFLAAIRFATSSPPSSMNDLKTSAQEQLEYMLTEDDDAPLLTADDEIKLEARQCVNRLLARFVNLVDSLLGDLHDSVAEAEKIELFQSHLTDLSWASQIVTKLETSSDFVYTWVETSVNIVKVAERVCPESSLTGTKLKVLEVTAKVLEAIVDSVGSDEENDLMLKADGELWQTLESAFVSIILTLPSPDQAEILTEWLENKHIRYPDLTEAFESVVLQVQSRQAKAGFAGRKQPDR